MKIIGCLLVLVILFTMSSCMARKGNNMVAYKGINERSYMFYSYTLSHQRPPIN